MLFMCPKFPFLVVRLPKFRGTLLRAPKAHPCVEWRMLSCWWSRLDVPRSCIVYTNAFPTSLYGFQPTITTVIVNRLHPRCHCSIKDICADWYEKVVGLCGYLKFVRDVPDAAITLDTSSYRIHLHHQVRLHSSCHLQYNHNRQCQ